VTNQTKATTDLAEIQRFAEGCEAVPATVRDTMEGDEPGVLTLDFLGYGAGEESLEHIGWDAWYEKFNAAKLALLYQERKADGEPSTFFKLVDRDSVDEDDLDARGNTDDAEEQGESDAQDDGPGGGARIRATVAASGAGSGGTLRATLETSSTSGSERSDGEGSSIDPPAPGDTKATTELAEIQRFAEGCEAVPATVRDTMEGDEPGVLTLDFLGYGAGEESLEHIGWDAWYQKFESSGLAFLYQERKTDGEPSTFFKLVDRDRDDT
jgi:hypothetical protein